MLEPGALVDIPPVVTAKREEADRLGRLAKSLDDHELRREYANRAEAAEADYRHELRKHGLEGIG